MVFEEIQFVKHTLVTVRNYDIKSYLYEITTKMFSVVSLSVRSKKQ